MSYQKVNKQLFGQRVSKQLSYQKVSKRLSNSILVQFEK